ncbi:hypothetical protein VTN00DRAFT_2934 [Thermoascus crustaceus]|uniref:uncharacterized protein n=1 Tax=Thermoascus crustaceus TaxID=5088 RepID=UPI003743D343
MPSIAGTNVLILGGTSGIGYAVAQAALREGAAQVHISSSNSTRVAATVSKLKSSSSSTTTGDVIGHTCDLSTDDVERRLEELLTAVTSSGDKLDHIIYTAGDALSIKNVTDPTFDLAYIQKAGQVRFFAPLLLAKLAPRYLKPVYSSSITFTSGTVAQRPMPDWTVIASYSAGMEGMVRSLALDLKPIRVNLVSPGAVGTEMWGDDAARTEAMMGEIGRKMPLGKAGRPEEVAEAYVYFMRDWNATGSVVSSNSGGLLV